MAAKTRDEILGFEHDWLVADSEGWVALFCTAGGGYVPASYLLEHDAHRVAIDALLATPAVTTAMFSEVSYSTALVIGETALRGLYVFDADFFGGPYRRVAVPTRPSSIDDLPLSVAHLVNKLRFTRIRFEAAPLVTADEISRLE